MSLCTHDVAASATTLNLAHIPHILNLVDDGYATHPVVFHDSVDNSELPTYCTKDNDTFIDVLQHVNIMPDQWHAYYQWIGSEFEFGHLYKGKTSGLHFVNPWGVNTRK
jgi:hypothetical protein